MATHTRLTAQHGALLVIDVQQKLIPRMRYAPLMIANTTRLIRGAQALGMPVLATEQYPQGLGPTVPELAALLPHRPGKTCFSCCGVGEIVEQLHGRGVRHVTLAGIETHVCVAQTALDLIGLGFVVQVPADAVASRQTIDWKFGLRRLERARVVVSTTEAALFEWTENADQPAFKTISTLVKEFVTPEPAA